MYDKGNRPVTNFIVEFSSFYRVFTDFSYCMVRENISVHGYTHCIDTVSTELSTFMSRPEKVTWDSLLGKLTLQFAYSHTYYVQ